KWDQKIERTTFTGRKIRTIPPEAVARQLKKIHSGKAVDVMPDDVSAFGLDLDNDGREDIVYAVDNVPRVAKLHENTGQAYAYFVEGGVFNGRSPAHPSIFLHDSGEYQGGTDAIAQIVLKGIVLPAAGSDRFAVLAKTGIGIDGNQTLVW